ncbi:hypothetical protein Pmar_PMAR014219, partial [Perkinsus marinus ATCC 50983]
VLILPYSSVLGWTKSWTSFVTCMRSRVCRGLCERGSIGPLRSFKPTICTPYQSAQGRADRQQTRMRRMSLVRFDRRLT